MNPTRGPPKLTPIAQRLAFPDGNVAVFAENEIANGLDAGLLERFLSCTNGRYLLPAPRNRKVRLLCDQRSYIPIHQVLQGFHVDRPSFMGDLRGEPTDLDRSPLFVCTRVKSFGQKTLSLSV